MAELKVRDFKLFFKAAYHTDPFPWQEELAGIVADGGAWPKTIKLPTASGKTCCIDIGLFALACQAEWPATQRTAPRRIFFVVDRRVIVDQAFDRSHALAKKLIAASDGPLHAVAKRLRALSGEQGEAPLTCHMLRGGIYRDDAWARTPSQPAVICSTVDQIGSRLLFRGYGHSSSMWPIHAGLAANDSLIFLDEAHCSEPFRQTLEAVGRYREWAEEPLPVPFQYSILSATPKGSEKPYELKAADRAHPVLSMRLKASKPARLILSKSKNGNTDFVEEFVNQANSLKSKTAPRVGILVNRVATAREIHKRFVKLREEKKLNADIVLMIGRMRSWDQRKILDDWTQVLKSNASSDQLCPVFVVATQCLEVGADFDFDALVSECASLDALRQRFGRLNRLGSRKEPAPGIIICSSDAAKEDDDPIYGPALARTWRWMLEHQTDGEIDLGIDKLDDLKPPMAELSRELDDAPIMLPAYVDAWTQTAPKPVPSPDVSIFLHGSKSGPPDVRVCWRSDLDPTDLESLPNVAERWRAAVALCPPASIECMSVPIYAVRQWIAGAKPDRGDTGDIEGARAPEGEEIKERPDGEWRVMLRWRGPKESELARNPEDIRPSDTLVIPATWMDDCAAFGHIPDDAPRDLGELANLRQRGRAVLRLRSARIDGLRQTQPFNAALQRLAELITQPEDNRDDDWSEELCEVILSEESGLRAIAECAEVIDCLNEQRKQIEILPHPCGGVVLRGPKILPHKQIEGETETQGTEDETSSATVEVSLKEHLDGVREKAEEFSRGCGFSKGLIADLSRAAALHDLGKLDTRFQALLRDGNLLAARTLPPLAKGIDRTWTAQERAKNRCGYPRGFRHEMLSFQLADLRREELLSGVHDPDLVLHLIASHHGHARPFAPVLNDPTPPRIPYVPGILSAELSEQARKQACPPHRLDSGIPERFWRLVRKYGWWGLAYLEAVLRLADHRQSEAEQNQK